MHSIDFRDHLGGGLNNLRLSNYFWESRLGRTSGFYTPVTPTGNFKFNEAAGFDIEVVNTTKWPSMPISAISQNNRSIWMIVILWSQRLK